MTTDPPPQLRPPPVEPRQTPCPPTPAMSTEMWSTVFTANLEAARRYHSTGIVIALAAALLSFFVVNRLFDPTAVAAVTHFGSIHRRFDSVAKRMTSLPVYPALSRIDFSRFHYYPDATYQLYQKLVADSLIPRAFLASPDTHTFLDVYDYYVRSSALFVTPERWREIDSAVRRAAAYANQHALTGADFNRLLQSSTPSLPPLIRELQNIYPQIPSDLRARYSRPWEPASSTLLDLASALDRMKVSNSRVLTLFEAFTQSPYSLPIDVRVSTLSRDPSFSAPLSLYSADVRNVARELGSVVGEVQRPSNPALPPVMDDPALDNRPTDDAMLRLEAAIDAERTRVLASALEVPVQNINLPLARPILFAVVPMLLILLAASAYGSTLKSLACRRRLRQLMDLAQPAGEHLNLLVEASDTDVSGAYLLLAFIGLNIVAILGYHFWLFANGLQVLNAYAYLAVTVGCVVAAAAMVMRSRRSANALAES